MAKVENLAGSKLDFWVAQAEGLDYAGMVNETCLIYRNMEGLTFGPGSNVRPVPIKFSPTTDWLDGGPIIEREHIAVVPKLLKGQIGWTASIPLGSRPIEHVYGDTILQAAMRCFVVSRYGTEVNE